MRRLLVVLLAVVTFGVVVAVAPSLADAAPDTPDHFEAVAIVAATAAAAATAVAATVKRLTHPVSQQTVINICDILEPGGSVPGGWTLAYWRHIHYGTADVVQCAYTLVLPGGGLSKTCWQYVWGAGVPRAYAQPYNPVRSGAPWCW